MKEPLVSIVTATRNRTDLLERALRSISEQTFDEYESIVVDDGSTADVQRFQRELVATLGERFSLLASPAPDVPGTGCSAARNRGAKAARGTFLAFLDDDDRWIDRHHLAVACEALEQFDADYYIAKIQGEENGQLLLKEVFYEYSLPEGAGRVVRREPLIYEISQRELLKMTQKHVFVHPDNSIVRRSVFERVHGFVNRLTYREDFNLMMRIADVCGRILFRPDVVASYRCNGGDSLTFTLNEVDKCLQNLYGAHHLRATCTSRDVRKAARADEGWTARRIALLLMEARRTDEALFFAWQALSTFPTAGAARDVLIAAGRFGQSRWKHAWGRYRGVK